MTETINIDNQVRCSCGNVAYIFVAGQHYCKDCYLIKVDEKPSK